MERSNSKQKIASLEIHLESNHQFLIQCKKKLIQLSSLSEKEQGPAIANLIEVIDNKTNFEYDYSIMMVHFEEMYPSFYTKLTLGTPSLTPKDLRVLSLMKIGLSNTDVAAIQNVTLGGIKKAIQRIRRKMKLDGNKSLRTYIASL